MIKTILSYLRKYPRLRKKIKSFYNSIISFLPRKALSGSVSLFDPFAAYNGETFFGYFDKSPVSPCGRYIVCHGLKKYGDVNCDILLYDRNTKKFDIIAQTCAWNYQQGARLHWNGDGLIGFNSLDHSSGNGIIYFLVDPVTFASEMFPYPFYETSNTGYFSINFNTLKQGDGAYSYRFFDQCSPMANSSSIVHFDKKNRTAVEIASFQSIDKIIGERCSLGTSEERALTHLHYNASIGMLGFIDRRILGDCRKDFLCIWSSQNNKLIAKEFDFVSHYCWLADRLICYSKPPGGTEGWYWIYSNLSIERCVELIDLRDGHPTLDIANTFKIYVDTYPDLFGQQSLYCCDLPNKPQKLLQLKAYTKNDPTKRCDLHPRSIKFDNEYFLAIDSNFSSQRRFYLLTENTVGQACLIND